MLRSTMCDLSVIKENPNKGYGALQYNLLIIDDSPWSTDLEGLSRRRHTHTGQFSHE